MQSIFINVNMALRKDLLNLNDGKVHIDGVEMMKINNRKNLMIEGKHKVEELYTKDDALNLDQETTKKSKICPYV